jgi:hypothetical protein
MLSALWFSTALAASSPPPPWMMDGGMTRPPEYPRERFFCDVGVGKSSSEARTAAIAAVVRIVRSEVSSHISTEMQRVVDLRGRESGATSMASTAQIDASFDRAEFVHIVGEHAYQGNTYAYACLDRGVTADAILHEVAEPLARFHGYLAQAQAAWRANDLYGFTAAYRLAMPAYQQVLLPASIVFTLSGGTDEAARGVGDGASWLAQTRATALAGARFVVQVQAPALDSTQQSGVVEAVQGAFAARGFAVGGRCSADGAWLVTVKVDVTSKFMTSLARWTASAPTSLSLNGCVSAGQPISVVLPAQELSATGQDEAIARTAAVARVSADRVSAALAPILADLFPVDP